jgi:hypothetical protein
MISSLRSRHAQIAFAKVRSILRLEGPMSGGIPGGTMQYFDDYALRYQHVCGDPTVQPGDSSSLEQPDTRAIVPTMTGANVLGPIQVSTRPQQ